jgi:DNA topoisomerase-2
LLKLFPTEIYLYEKNTKSVTYSDFVNKELVLFSNLDNERSIPSIVDGFKPGQRKVMFTCLKRNDKREVKVAQLAGSVGEMSAYHHGEASLMGTIINLAQNFVGSNNINLLQPIGQFGTRLAGGKDHASPRYIFTQMSPLARHIFNVDDDAILNYLKDDNQKIEPEWYMPIIPLVLVNGADGIGTGWMTKIPNYNPREIVENMYRMLKGLDPEEMTPWFKGYSGTIENLGDQRYVLNGEIASISDTKVEIRELPVRTWTQTFKEQTMEAMLNGSEKTPSLIQDYKEYHTDKTVKFVVQMQADKLRAAELQKGLHQFFKLQTTLSTSSMVLFDAKGCLRRYESAEDILKEFYGLRLDYYHKRKQYLEGMLEAEALKLSNQARFILEKCDGSLTIENKKKKMMVDELQRRGYDSDPIRKWKKSQNDEAELDAEDDSEALEDNLDTALDYDYLLGMAMWCLTKEKKDALLKKKDEKHQELKKLRETSKEDLWKRDLREFLAKLDEVERIEKEEDEAAMRKAKAKAQGPGGGKKNKLKMEAHAPSPAGIRIQPRIADELRTKVAKAAQAKDRKGKKAAGGGSAIKEEDIDKDEYVFRLVTLSLTWGWREFTKRCLAPIPRCFLTGHAPVFPIARPSRKQQNVAFTKSLLSRLLAENLLHTRFFDTAVETLLRFGEFLSLPAGRFV